MTSRTRSIKRVSLFAALVISALALVCFSPSAGGVFSAEETSAATFELSPVLYDSSSGLPTSEANAVAQSAEGFIWIGGYSGLIRYDGNEFYRYPSSSGIASVKCLFVDSQNRLWIGTNENGIAVLNGDKFKFYTRADGLKSSSIRSIVEDDEGNIMIATTQGLAYVDTTGTLRVINEPLLNKECIKELVSANGLIYGVTKDTWHFFTLSSHKLQDFYDTSEIWEDTYANTIYPDPDDPDFVYIGTRKSEIYYGNIKKRMADAVKSTVFTQVSKTVVNCIKKVNGRLWVCSDNGVGYVENGEFVQPDLPMTNSVDRMMEDYEGNLWFTSSRQGVMKIAASRFVNISQKANLETAVVNTTCKYKNDLYIGTDKKGLIILNEDYVVKNNALTALLEGVRIRCIKKDAKGFLWICTYGSDYGLVRYDPETGEYKSYNSSNADAGEKIISNDTRMVAELSDGSIAVATDGGVDIISDGIVTAAYDKENGLTNTVILCIAENSDGTLFFGSDGDGIYMVNGSRKSRLGLDDGLESEVIMRMQKDPVEKDMFWIITSNSIAHMKDGKITTVKNFPYSNNFDLYFNSDNRAWILSSNGIYIVKRADLIDDGEDMEYTLYDRKCGLPGTSTANSFSHIGEDGSLIISASTGVYSVNINEEEDSGSDIKLSIPFIYADDVYIGITGDKAARIPSTCKRLTVYANAFTYSLNNPQLSYRLEGFDDDPVNLTKQNMSSVSYTNLSGGTYKFVISILDPVTGEVVKTASVTIIKDKTLMETLWFKLALVILVIALGVVAAFVITKYKTNKFVKKQKENQKLINEMTRVFANCIDMKDAYTNGHSVRVATYTAMIAKKMGKSESEVEQIYNIALLHDIGKISIPDSILNKQGKLDDAEYMVMKSHSSRGYEILKDITIAPGIALGACYHHERYDGRGYPAGLKGDAIPEVAQIIAVADTFDAMYSTRPYRRKLPLEEVVAEIKRCSGTQFNPKVVDVFLDLVKEGAFRNIKSV
ncbi:MAG: HD domain-containing protein [Clostridia bacterium]|nr:HD domain-containing protein [Clostridia bacterium]